MKDLSISSVCCSEPEKYNELLPGGGDVVLRADRLHQAVGPLDSIQSQRGKGERENIGNNPLSLESEWRFNIHDLGENKDGAENSILSLDHSEDGEQFATVKFSFVQRKTFLW